jgi:hypothetical protein
MTGQTAMGAAIAGICAFGLWHDRWLIEQTAKGRLLAHWFGNVGGLRVLRLVLVGGMLFGALLAADFIRPIHWKP